MKAADIMTLNPITVEPNASVMQAVRLMLQHRISGLPVVDTMDNLVGIVTEGDLLRRAETGTQRRRPRWLEFLIGPGAHGERICARLRAKSARSDERERPHHRGGFSAR